jgi:hypothetical protein
MTDDEPPARPVFAGIDQESWALFAERERRWLFDAVEWLLRRGRPSEEAAQGVSGKPRHEERGGRSIAPAADGCDDRD